MSIKRDIANKLGLNLKEQAIVFQAIDLYEAAKSKEQPDDLTTEEHLGFLAEDLLRMLADHVHNCQTPLRTKLCALIRPYMAQSEREFVNAGDRKEAAQIIANFFVNKLASHEAPHNATIYAEWALTALLRRFDIRRRGS